MKFLCMHRLNVHPLLAFAFWISVLSVVSLHGQPVLDSFDANVNGTVRAIAVQPDGKIIIGGDFTSVGGSNYASLARLHRDGTVDASFTNRAVTNVLSLALQADGKILVGWSSAMIRVNTDGTRDTTYGVVSAVTNIGAIIVQPDGRALASRQGATFRLNASGTLSFSAPHGNPVMALQMDGKIVFRSNYWGEGTLRRLNANGTLDTNFSVTAYFPGNPTYTYISALIIQPDGKILAGGLFDWLNGPKSSLGRLNPDSTLDPDFTASAFGVGPMARQSNGKIVFYETSSSIRRCTSTGSSETNFEFTVSGGDFYRVQKIALQPDGNILVAGSFTSVNGETRNSLARIIAGDLPPGAPPQFTSISKHPGNVFRFHATNLDQTNLSALAVLFSPKVAAPLNQWTPVASPVSLVGGEFQFTDPSLATNPPARFYRLSYQP
ncbi:MAG TPA: hypothetical protein VGF13_19550 [Verrucomicrobiae bacterium]